MTEPIKSREEIEWTLCSDIAKVLFKARYPDLEWGHSGTVDDESWRQIERKCLKTSQQIITLFEPYFQQQIKKAVEQESERIGEAKKLIEQLIDEGDCEFSIHGYCDRHPRLESGAFGCPNRTAKEFLQSLKEGKDE